MKTWMWLAAILFMALLNLYVAIENKWLLEEHRRDHATLDQCRANVDSLRTALEEIHKYQRELGK